MNAVLPNNVDLASYVCNIWEHRQSGARCGEVHDTLDDAYLEIVEGSDKFRYVETITRARDGTLTVANLCEQADDWDHQRKRSTIAEAYRQQCFTRQPRRAAE